MEPRYPYPIITFSEEDPIHDHCIGDNPFVITADIENTHVHRIYVDGESSAEIMYEHCFNQPTTEHKKKLQPPTTPLVGFVGQKSWPLGIISLPLTLINYRGHIRKTIMVEFMIIRASSPYNVILGRPTMKQLGKIASTLHSIMKFPTRDGIAVVRGETPRPMCNQISRKRDRISEEEKSPNEENHEEKIVTNEDYPEQKVII
ncbi:hypothetical protein Tco_0353648 [Tanacetum coccineum]